jgi:peroxiredoxin
MGNRPLFALLGLSVLVVSMFAGGCGGTPGTSAPAMQTQSSAAAPETAPPMTAAPPAAPVVSEDDAAAASPEPLALPEPEKGSPEWMIREIARLRAAPLDAVRQPISGQRGQFEEIKLTPAQVEQEKNRRNEQVVDLAMQTIAKTHQDKSKEQIFNNAVHYLTDARMQLALSGQEDQSQLLSENVEALFKRDATSFAAVDAASQLLQLTQSQAQRHVGQDPQWAQAYARQARLFAEKFPQESSRAAVNLIAAGKLCEQAGDDAEALACLTVIEQKFPETPFSDQAAGALRRLRLPGQPLTDFGGSTHDGGFISIDQFKGKAVLIVFWASNSAQFRTDLPAIQQALKQYEQSLAAVGVNLDKDERAVDRFLEETGISWKHIFYSDAEKRGARNLVARHYGVSNVPQYWLVDAQGVVRSIHVDVNRLGEALTQTFAQR